MIQCSQAYHVATLDQIWEYVQRPRYNRYSLNDRKECNQTDCKNTILQPNEFPHDERLHHDVAYRTETTFVETEVGITDEGEWKEESEEYEVNEKKELRRKRDHMVITRTPEEKRIRTTEPHTRRPGRFICKRCRDAIYCSKDCAFVDHARHSRECSETSPDILKCLVNEDIEGVRMILQQKGQIEALRFFGTHSLWEFAEEIDNLTITSDLAVALQFAIEVMSKTSHFDRESKKWESTVRRVFEAGFVPSMDIQSHAWFIKTHFGPEYLDVCAKSTERAYKRNKRREFQELAYFTETVDFSGVADMWLTRDSVYEAVIQEDTEEYTRIHRLRKDLIDYERDIKWAQEEKLPFMAEWLQVDLQLGVEIVIFLKQNNARLNIEWNIRDRLAARDDHEAARMIARWIDKQEEDTYGKLSTEERAKLEQEEFEPTVPDVVHKDFFFSPTLQNDDMPALGDA